jgi:uncharacterized protein YbjT (DUF2867 family)
VRALVRTLGPRTAALETEGVEIAVGDLNDRRSLLPALQGVETAYFAYPVAAGIVQAAANFASAGRAAGLRRLVVMSMGAAHPESPSHLGRAQWLAEELFETSGFSCLHLRVAAFFFENLGLLHGADIRGDGVLRNAFADVPFSWMAGEDAGKLAAAALLHPDRFGDQTAVYPTGGDCLSHADIADLLGKRLGRPLRHETISQQAWEARLLERMPQDARLNADMARHICSLAAVMKKPAVLNGLFEAVTGERPQSLKTGLPLCW